MKRSCAAFAALLVCAAALPLRVEAAAKTAAELEKEKALASPYPNDLGPDRLTDEELAAYSPAEKEGYKLLVARCAQCHSAARPLNSRFVEPEGKDAAVAALQKSNPELFKDTSIRQIEGAVWNRYVKRMMAKPGCAVTVQDGRKIWEFMVYDSKRRKTGKNAAAWRAHRRKLLEEFSRSKSFSAGR